MPYSDPVMDGPIIQRAVDAALAGGTRVRDTIRAVEQVAGRGAPVLVMTYWNLVLRYGVDAFARDLAAAGGAGLITPDLIPDEAAEWIAASDAHGLDRVFLVAPSSTPERLASTSAASRGFVYAASTMGVTGERATVGDRAAELVAAHPGGRCRARVRRAGRLPPRAGRGGGRLRRRRHRRVGAGARAARRARTRRPGSDALARVTCGARGGCAVGARIPMTRCCRSRSRARRRACGTSGRSRCVRTRSRSCSASSSPSG